MKCKNCGYEVESNYRFCAKCGHPVEWESETVGDERQQQEPCGSTEEQLIAEDVEDSGATAQEDDAAPQEDEAAAQDAAASSAEAISQDDAAAQGASTPPANPASQENAAASNQAGEPRHPSSQDLVSKHLSGGKIPKPAILAGAAVVVVLIVVVCFGGLSGLLNGNPDRGRIEADVRAELSDWADDGEYGYGDSYEISSIEIVDEERESLEGTLFGGVGSEYYGAEVKVKASTEAADAERTVSVSYVKQGNSWEPFSASTGDSQYTAKKGPNEEKIKQNTDAIIRRADNWSDVQELYGDGTYSVGDVKLADDGQSCSVAISCDTESPYFDAHCDANAKFTFDNGNWIPEEVTLGEDAGKRSFDKLIGTWKGAFKETDATRGNDVCYGAENKEFTLEIESIDSDTGKVKGTFTGLAHYHGPTDNAQDSMDGDTMVGPAEFTATISEDEFLGRSIFDERVMQFVAEYETQQTSDGTVRIEFGFGAKNDPNVSYASVVTTHEYDYENTSLKVEVQFEDIYTLTKA